MTKRNWPKDDADRDWRFKQPRCTAARKSDGTRCRFPVVPGREVCRFHGGLTPRGIANANWVHGKTSRYPLPGRLSEKYELSVNDPEILNLTQEIALVDSRTGELLGKLGTGEAGSAWRQVVDSFDALETAINTSDTDGVRSALEALSGAIRAGSRDFELWSGIIGLVDQRRRLVESEQKRRIAMQTSVKIEDIIGIANALTGIIRRNVTDPATLNRISAEFQHLMYAGVMDEETNTT